MSTRLDAPFDRFPTTQWTQIVQAGSLDLERLAALDTLARRYWRPIREFIRARVGCDHAADDLTQEFFQRRILEGHLLQKVDRARCRRFRTFLTFVLDRFVIDEYFRKSNRKLVLGRSLTGVEDPAAIDAENALDESWRAELLTDSFRRLEKEMREQDMGVCFEVFRDYFLIEGDGPDYRILAERFNLTAPGVSGCLQRSKKRLREILRAAVEATVDPEELEAEWTWLFDPE